MKERTKRIVAELAARDGVSPEYVEQEMREAIREAMQSTAPKARELWKYLSPDGQEPDLDTFLEFVASGVNMMMDGDGPVS